MVHGKLEWIAAKLDQFDDVRHLLGERETASPEAFDLLMLAESWRVEYRKTKAKTVGARTDQQGRILVYGAVSDNERCKAALRRWLARRAKEKLIPWLELLSTESGLRFNRYHHQEPAYPMGKLFGRRSHQPKCQTAVSPPRVGAVCVDA